MRVEIARGLDGLRAIESEWRCLSENMSDRHYFHLHGWYEALLAQLERKSARVGFFVFRKGSEVVAIVPMRLTRARAFGLHVRALEIPHHDYVAQCDVLVHAQADIEEIGREFLSALKAHDEWKWDVIRLPKIVDRSNATAILNAVHTRVSARHPRSRCDYLVLEDGDYVRTLSRNMRRNLTKARNRLNESGAASLDIYDDGEALQKGFEQFLDLEASGWKGAEGTRTAIRCLPDKEAFFRDVVTHLGAEKLFRILILRVEGTPISGVMTVWLGDTCHSLKTAYDEQWARVKPGHLIKEELVRLCGRDPRIRYINLVSNSQWHEDWRPHTCDVYDGYLFNNTLGGLLYRIALQRKSRQGGSSPPRVALTDNR